MERLKSKYLVDDNDILDKINEIVDWINEYEKIVEETRERLEKGLNDE